jgi:dolichyl-diphosphooligosaccharide--protein glycosyltransferase
MLCYLAPIGLLTVLFRFSDASSFLFVYALPAYFFSHKMVRLILLTAPIASILGGIVVGRVVAWSISLFLGESDDDDSEDGADDKKRNSDDRVKPEGKKKKKDKKSPDSFAGIAAIKDGFAQASKSQEGKVVKVIVAIVLCGSLYKQASTFTDYSWKISVSLSNPSIILRGQTREGNIVTLDDYREAYWWLRDNTPDDARIMAWWDYGYQITGIANRTTIADGNTWNHEHIAFLGKILTGPVEEGYQMARHLADYVLIWGGGGGDDLAKSPHLARIANSVYRDHCPGDVTCAAFGFVVSSQCPFTPLIPNEFIVSIHTIIASCLLLSG